MIIEGLILYYESDSSSIEIMWGFSFLVGFLEGFDEGVDDDLLGFREGGIGDEIRAFEEVL